MGCTRKQSLCLLLSRIQVWTPPFTLLPHIVCMSLFLCVCVCFVCMVRERVYVCVLCAREGVCGVCIYHPPWEVNACVLSLVQTFGRTKV